MGEGNVRLPLLKKGYASTSAVMEFGKGGEGGKCRE
jgi:hypothetical protein